MRYILVRWSTHLSSEAPGMDLILWRHADAEDGLPDMARALTAKGHKQAADMAQWLTLRLPKDARLLVSPAVRAQQTARALARDYDTIEQISPGAPHTAVLAVAGWPDGKGTVVIVGHQPTLGQVAAWTLSGKASEWNVKKSAIWWFTCRDRGGPRQVVLRAVMAPDLA
jgi:phosphohistidine phosphatase